MAYNNLKTEDLLELIRNEQNNPSGEQAAKSQIPDFMELVGIYQRENKCNKFQAMHAINRLHPNSRRAYLQKHNPGKAF